MNNKSVVKLLAIGLTLGSLTNTAEAALTGVNITEWMYNSSISSGLGEFVEFTNFGATTVDFTGWSFDDNSRTAGSQSLSGFGLVAAGESVIFTDNTAAAFRTEWNLSSGVKIIGGNTNNLGRSDEINLYDATNALIDRLTYNDQSTGSVAGPRTSGVSGVPTSFAAIGGNNASLWILSTVGNLDGAHLSLSGDLGSPGKSTFAPVPLPGAFWLFGSALVGLGSVRRCRKIASINTLWS